jgi:mRNA-degrading endonuclease RelE of RelBE toxin-antitoxin system
MSRNPRDIAAEGTFRLHTFSYNLVYVVESDEIVILAVAHHKRRPGYWRGRLS